MLPKIRTANRGKLFICLNIECVLHRPQQPDARRPYSISEVPIALRPVSVGGLQVTLVRPKPFEPLPCKRKG
jgi:hypothetical protein